MEVSQMPKKEKKNLEKVKDPVCNDLGKCSLKSFDHEDFNKQCEAWGRAKRAKAATAIPTSVLAQLR